MTEPRDFLLESLWLYCSRDDTTRDCSHNPSWFGCSCVPLSNSDYSIAIIFSKSFCRDFRWSLASLWWNSFNSSSDSEFRFSLECYQLNQNQDITLGKFRIWFWNRVFLLQELRTLYPSSAYGSYDLCIVMRSLIFPYHHTVFVDVFRNALLKCITVPVFKGRLEAFLSPIQETLELILGNFVLIPCLSTH